MGEHSKAVRVVSGALSALLLAGCTPEPANYPAPDSDQALSAIQNGIRSDFIDTPPRHAIPDDTVVGPGDDPDEAMQKVGDTMLSLSEANGRMEARDDIDGLVKVELGRCEWQSVNIRRIREYARHRFEDRVPAAYLCDYRVTSAAETRGLVAANGQGYFYEEGGAFFHAIIEQSSWEEDRR
jgi:hypothetical protein